MFYRFDASELAKAWSRVVFDRNAAHMSAEDEINFRRSLSESMKLACENSDLTALSKHGFPIKLNQDSSTEYFLDLQEFCNWGQRLANSGIPQDEFELAHMLGIHELDEYSVPLRASQQLHPETQRFKDASGKLNASHLGRLLGRLDAVALPVTPPLTIERAEGLKNLVEMPDPQRRLLTLRQLGGNAYKLHGDWKFRCLKVLEMKERMEGRRRCSAKTIRKDLLIAVLEEERLNRTGKTSYF